MHHPSSLLLSCVFALHHLSPHPSPSHSSPPSSSILSISSVTPLISSPHHSPHPFICHPCVLSSSEPPPIMLHHSSVIPSSFIPRPRTPSSLPSLIPSFSTPLSPVTSTFLSPRPHWTIRPAKLPRSSCDGSRSILQPDRSSFVKAESDVLSLCCFWRAEAKPGPGENSPLKSHFVFSPSPPRWRLMHYSVRCGRSETAINKYQGYGDTWT